MSQKLISVPAFAKANGINQVTLYRNIRDGHVPHIKIGKRVYLKPDVLDSLFVEAKPRD